MLKRLFDRDQVSGRRPKCCLHIVAISAIGLSTPAQWLDRKEREPWLRTLVEDAAPQAEIWEFAYSEQRQESFSETILREGSNLFESIHKHYEGNERRVVPLLLIAHGTGGLILKKALNLFHAQHYRYRHVVDVIRGVVVLGSPHLVPGNEQAKETLDILLKCQKKGLGRSLSSGTDIANIFQICETFEQIHLVVPVISVYESEGVQTQKKIFSLRNKIAVSIVVPRQICSWTDTSPGAVSATESIFDGRTNHIEVCHLHTDGNIYGAIKELVTQVVATGPGIIAEISGTRILPQALRDISLASQSEFGGLKLSPNVSSGLATGGTSLGSIEHVPQPNPDISKPKDPCLPCFSLGTHRRLDSFFGRADILSEIDRFLLPGASVQNDGAFQDLRSFTICGLGGMGKSELAVEYAHTRKEHFEAVFWLSADDSSILAAEFAKIAQELGLQPEDDAQDLAASRDVVIGWLANPRRTAADPESPHNEVNWLLVFDNVDNQDVLSDYWPKTGRGSVLVTSRDPFARYGLHTKFGLDLAPLSKEESTTLIQQLTMVKADQAQQGALFEIAEKLGGFPLSIQTMSGVFKKLRLSYNSFLHYYNEVGIKRLHEQAGDTQSEKSRSLVTLWALEELSKKTRALLELLSILDPDEIPEDLLISKSNSGPHDLEDYPCSAEEYYAARSELLSSSLISQNPEQEKISLHRLIQETTRRDMDSDQLVKVYNTAIQLTVNTWPFQSMKEHHFKARFKKCESLFPSVLRLKDGLETLILEQNFPLSAYGIHIAGLFNDTGWYVFERGLIAELRSFCTLALKIGQRLQHGPAVSADRVVRESHSYLGIAAAETNEHSFSMVHKQKWLDILLTRQDGNGELLEDYELGYAYNEIGVAYANNDMLDDAANAFTRSIEIFQTSPTFEDTNLGWPQPNLGFVYWLQGKFDKAEEVLVEILDIHAAEWGVDDTTSFKTGKILYALGNVLEDQERFQESQNFHERAHEQYKVTLGLVHHRMGDICCRLARHCMRQGLHDDADNYLSRAIKIFDSRPYLANEKARATFLRGQLHHSMGEEGQAKRVLMQAWRLRRKLVPQDTRKYNQLAESDYNKLVAFWSR
ncbi:Tetratricopeptide repeat [Pyrenophora tritici-repentis]|nr:Tetratricopeptide repeat [Pyrenophora tritici-repentis]